MDVVGDVRGLISARVRLLRLLPRGGAGPAGTLVGLQIIRAAVPTVRALSVGYLVAVLGGSGGDRPVLFAACLVAAVFLIDQTVWLTLSVAGPLVAKRIDGGLRSRLRTLAIDADLDPEFAQKWFTFVVAEVIRHHVEAAEDR